MANKKYQLWDDALKQFATDKELEYALPEGSLHQIINQESKGRLNLTSKAGAYGLTQLMPATAKEMGVTDLNDPYQQIDGGAKYYAKLFHENAKGDPVIAAGMYNSGPNRRAYKINDTRLLPAETQNYMNEFNKWYVAKTAPSTAEKVGNFFISPAYGETTPYANKLNQQKNDIGVGELTPEQFARLAPKEQLAASPELTPEEYAAIQQGPGDELTPEQFAALQPVAPTQPQRALNLDLAKEAVGNIIPSAKNLLTGVSQVVANAAMNPVDTASGLSNVLTGEIQKIIPGKSPAELLGISGPVPADATKEFDTAMYNRYGTGQNILNTLATDPVGFAADIAGPAKGIGGIAKGAITKAMPAAVARSYTGASGPSVGLLQGAQTGLNAISKLSPLLTPVSSAISTAAPLAGKAVSYPLSMISGIEQPALSAAVEAGRQSVKQLNTGGLLSRGTRAPEQTAFIEAKRGNVPDVAVVNQAKDALSTMRINMSDNYKSGMSTLPGANDVLDFTPINDAFVEANKIKNFNGKQLDPSANAVKNEISGVLSDWAGSDPTTFHTTYGLDALKQRIGDIRSSTDPHTPSRAIVDKIYNSIGNQIKTANPGYAKIMEDYSSTISQINEIEKELSLGEKANPSTALRKLQSIMRNNANTSWGRRADLAKELSSAGAPNLEYSLAGQATNAMLPRGLSRLGSTGLIGGQALMGNPLGALATGLLSSPQITGALANIAGKGVGIAEEAFKPYNAIPFKGILSQQNRDQNQ